MKISPTPKVADVKLVAGNVEITFEDGFFAVFPPGLLFASRNLAKIMIALPYDEPTEPTHP